MQSKPQISPRRRLVRLLIVLVLSAGAAAWRFRPAPYDPLMGLGDYEQLRHRLDRIYANLDWSATRGGLDLRELHAQTYHSLAYARSKEEAERILRGFVRSFHDPHMTLRPSSAPLLGPQPARENLSRSTTPEAACAALVYKDDPDDLAFTLDEKAGFRRLNGANSFPAAVLDAGERRFGLLRIGSFAERNYRGACLREWPRFREALRGTCEPRCQRDFDLSVSRRLLRELAFRIRELERAGAGALLIDVTDNRGGHAWHRRAAELFTSQPIAPFHTSLVKGFHTEDSLADDRQRIFHYLARRDLPASEREVLLEALCRLDNLVAEAGQPCGAGAVWTGEPWRMGCSRLTTRPHFDGGLFDRDPGPDFPFEIAQILYVYRAYGPRVSLWNGPVAVLVDEGTGSAGELFAASLKFSAGAVLLGRHTVSAGGGWSLGRTAWPLLRTKMNLYAPDSVDYLPDGTNAREGLDPDIRTPMSPRDHPDLTARWLARVLPNVILPPVAPGSPR